MPVQVKLIDFGAAVDMCTGINFNPQTGMLDPRYRCVSHSARCDLEGFHFLPLVPGECTCVHKLPCFVNASGWCSADMAATTGACHRWLGETLRAFMSCW